MSHILQKVAPIGESRDKELLKSASNYLYATRDGAQLLAHVFAPEGSFTTPRPAIIFFHGGFWDAAMVTQFVPHCHHFASRGAVSIAFETRIGSKHGTGPIEALEDARSALEWLRDNAVILGIDTSQIVFAGAAGGAWLALVLTMKQDKHATPVISPKAAILFSALVNTTPKGQLSERFPDGKMAKLLSPSSLVKRKLPPMMFIHGKADRVAPFEEVATFCRRMKWRRNNCRLLDFTGAEHSFFNFNVSHSNFEMTISGADNFLVELGILQPGQDEEPS
ncbi:MAG: alpha/beta hydrolase [Akkermansiaceae bacterium]|jgi:acetyl esterase|nr:alpha/beta hydrolase [Akkermansiaceae bacterium]MDP4647192.1 alpha/beta hydrolase [Akkermansiaceae bacterium]MDP4720110.1 alpha/beta hydrolase [Akkermansiaceae bacterium]MDP4780931.1 alpha/beta hydrolase [Akkermansiaceae bacterium]MDP4845754.1 alpha/beta hydrolase [Akkermansiaceae bacterium]